MRPENQRDATPRYTIIPRTLIFLTRGDEILLLRGAADKRLWAGKYNGLGGHIEANETPLASALRELEEESGITTVLSLELRALIHVGLSQPPGVMLFVFVGRCDSGELRASEEGMPEWVKRDALKDLPLVEDLPELLPRVLTPGPLVFGSYTFVDSQLRVRFEG